MDRRMRYAKTRDDVDIAYWTLGSGPPLVYMTGGPWNHLDMWEVPSCREWFETLAAHRTVVRYDNRGTGHSQRDVVDFSLDAQVADLEAVLDAVDVDREVDVFAGAGAGPVAIAFAARNPERVSKLILWCSWADGARVSSPRIRAWLGMLDEDWDLMTDTCAHLVMGWAGNDVGRAAASRLRKSVEPDVAREALAAARAYDARTLLADVRAPTLVLHRSDVPWLSPEMPRELAAGISESRLTMLVGESAAPYVGELGPVVRSVREFLGFEPTRTAPEPVTVVDPLPDGLTGREVEVLALLASGLANKEIAAELSVSVRTVERHVANVYDKIGARGRANATAYALSRGLVSPQTATPT